MKNLEEKKEILKELKKLLQNKNDNIIYAIVTKVAPSGMSRRIKFHTIKNNELYNITQYIAIINDEKCNYNGLLAQGCGMDMIFNEIYNFNSAVCELDNIKPTFENCNHILFNVNYRSL